MAINPKFKRLYIRRNSRGQVIPGSDVERRNKPKIGDWIDITNAVRLCCNGQGDSYIIFKNSSTDTNITAIEFTGYSWSGTLENGDYLVAVIPNGYDETITMTMSAPGATIDINGTTVQGDGVISVDPDVITTDPDPVTTTITTTSVPNSQYLVEVVTD